MEKWQHLYVVRCKSLPAIHAGAPVRLSGDPGIALQYSMMSGITPGRWEEASSSTSPLSLKDSSCN